jgi:CDP-diacylglycerol---glycerol-3-phosphate 3-phosphatidyltransferase
LFRESKLGLWYLKWVEKVPIPLFARLAFKPNHLTFLAFFLSLMTIPAYLYALWLGGIGVLLSGIADTLDGGLARRTHQNTKSGAFLDSVLDRYSDFFMTLGIWFYFLTHPHPLQRWITFLLFLFLSGSFLVSYSRARGEGLGLSVSVGFFGRAERIVLLGAGSIINDVFQGFFPSQVWLTNDGLIVPLLVLLTIGTHLTAFQRISYLAKHL